MNPLVIPDRYINWGPFVKTYFLDELYSGNNIFKVQILLPIVAKCQSVADLGSTAKCFANT